MPQSPSSSILSVSLIMLFLCATLQASGPQNGSSASEAVLVPEDEPGVPLVVSGTVYLADGKTPVAGARLYVYHTDNEGHYSKGGVDESKRRLNATLITDAQGRYRLRTIRPAPYPGQGPPAHIHFELTPPGGTTQYLEIWFDDDPKLSEAMRRRYADKTSFGHIMTLTMDAQGTWHCTKDFRV